MAARGMKQGHSVFASAREWEALTGNNQTITINNGVANAIYSETAGDVIQITNTRETAKTSPVLQAGMNEFEVTSITGAGTTLAGNSWAIAW
jgi:hypothetical protein